LNLIRSIFKKIGLKKEGSVSLLKSPRNSEWIGCIDFGTALSKVAVAKRKPRTQLTNNDIVPLAIGVRAGVGVKNPYLLPSMVYVTDQRVLFGEEAQTAALRGAAGRQAFASPKQYLSTDQPESLDEKLDPSVDPTGNYTPRELLALFFAHLLVQIGHFAPIAGVPWPVPLRIARPAWEPRRAKIGELTLKTLVLQASAIADVLGDRLSALNGLTHGDARSALSIVMANDVLRDPRAFPGVFELSPEGSASVLEATAVAAGSIRETGRRVIAIADIGGGTSDFGAFMTGLPGREVLAEIIGSSLVLREAGDYLDMLLTSHILDRAGIDREDPAGRGLTRRLRLRQRATKEALFAEGVVRVEIGDDTRNVTLEEFLTDPRVQSFVQRLRSKFQETLEIAVECAREHPQPDGQGTTPVEILITGGGHALPMVKEIATTLPMQWPFLDTAPELPTGPIDQDLQIVRRQLAVAIGGAIQDLPHETAPVRL
jgi:molecular chaperone DnaK (HSP70)